MNITTKSNQLVLTLMVLFFSLMLACKSKEEVVIPPNQPPGNFNVTSTLSTNGQDVILKWNKSKDPEGDLVTYSVVYNDTLARNLSDTTYTIKNLPFETEIKGTIVAKDTKGNKTVSSFTMQTGMDYVAIPDANFEKFLIKLKIDDVQDGKILRSSVLKVTALDVSGVYEKDIDKIINLTGIEVFINLKNFNCSNNKITQIDISKNIALTELDCSSNKLTKLDVSNNLSLNNLNCFQNNLPSLDVRKNIGLKSLACFYNNLNSLDVSTNTALEFLNCENNKLSNLDISKNSILTTLFCGRNILTNIDMSKNLTLTDIHCDENKLSDLDVSKQISLKVLWCGSNQLASLDVSKNISIERIVS